MTDGLIKQELDAPDHHPLFLQNSPTHGSSNFLSGLPGVADHEDFAPAPLPLNSTVQADMESLRDRSMSLSGIPPLSNIDDFSEHVSAQVASSIQADLESYAAEEAATVPNVEPMQAYAKLQFSDGDFYVSTQAVELGRDLSAMKYERRIKKQERRKKEHEAARTVAEAETETPAQLDKTHFRRVAAMSASNANETGGIIGNLLYSGIRG